MGGLTHQEMRSTLAPFRRTILASKAGARGLLPCTSLPPTAFNFGTTSSSSLPLTTASSAWTSGASLPVPRSPEHCVEDPSSNNLRSTLRIFVRSLAMPRSLRPYSPGLYGENGVWEDGYRACVRGCESAKAGGSFVVDDR